MLLGMLLGLRLEGTAHKAVLAARREFPAHRIMTPAIVRTAGLPLTRVARGDPALRELYEAGYTLIRPDRTVAWRGDGFGDAAGLVDVVRGAGNR